MAITDFNRKKSLDITSITGTPSISYVIPIKITSGDDSTTGIGDIVIDWTNISTKADIAVYDESDVLLDYSFEEFDTTAEIAIIRVYKTWVRDGTTQLQIAYGNGLSDQSVVSSIVFSKETNLVAGWTFCETSGDLIDVSGNGFDGTVFGATRGQTGIVGCAYDFDGSSDYIQLPNTLNSSLSTGSISFYAWINPDNTSSAIVIGIIGSSGIDEYKLFRLRTSWDNWKLDDGGGPIGVNFSTQPPTDSWTQIVGVYDNSAGKMHVYVNGALDATSNGTVTNTQYNEDAWIGADPRGQDYFNGKIDDLRMYNEALSADAIKAKYDSSKLTQDFFTQKAAEDTGGGTVELFIDGNIVYGLNYTSETYTQLNKTADVKYGLDYTSETYTQLNKTADVKYDLDYTIDKYRELNKDAEVKYTPKYTSDKYTQLNINTDVKYDLEYTAPISSTSQLFMAADVKYNLDYVTDKYRELNKDAEIKYGYYLQATLESSSELILTADIQYGYDIDKTLTTESTIDVPVKYNYDMNTDVVREYGFDVDVKYNYDYESKKLYTITYLDGVIDYENQILAELRLTSPSLNFRTYTSKIDKDVNYDSEINKDFNSKSKIDKDKLYKSLIR